VVSSEEQHAKNSGAVVVALAKHQVHTTPPSNARRTLDSMAPNTRAAANWAASRVVTLLELWALVVGVCMLLLWQTGKCIHKHACRALTSSFTQTPLLRKKARAEDEEKEETEKEKAERKRLKNKRKSEKKKAKKRATDRVVALPEFWTVVAEHSGLVGAWRLTGVSRAAREGAKAWLRTLPGLVVCGGRSGGVTRDDVWRLDLRWGRMPGLVTARTGHACCAVRGKLVVLGGSTSGGGRTSSVEMLSSEEGAFVDLPPLSCGGIWGAAAVAVGESDSAAGQVLLLGGVMEGGAMSRTVHLVDLATGVCTPGRPDMFRSRWLYAAIGLPDGRIVCAGRYGGSPAEMWGPPVQGAPDAEWSWRHLPAMGVGRDGCSGCVMSDGRFAVLGGRGNDNVDTSSCEALAIGDDGEHWEPLLPMHDPRSTLLARLLQDASSSPEGWVAIQLNSTMRCSVGGCDFRSTHLKTVAARFYRRNAFA
jgi:hypothetical protein